MNGLRIGPSSCCFLLLILAATAVAVPLQAAIATSSATRHRRLLGAVKQNSSCVFSDSTCTVDLRYFADLPSGIIPETDIHKLLARSIADQCYPEDTANVTEKGCPLDSYRIFHASLLRNYVYCPGSLLDQAITCLETTTEGSCSANAACVWTDRFFGVWDKATGTNDASRIMMSAVDRTISESVGWLKGPHDTVLADKYYSDSVVMPFKYCAARWTINETALVSLYDGFSGWQKVALPDDTTMLRSAAALLGTAGQAITGTCAAGKQFTDWASVCTNAGSKETCPGSLNSVSCQWDPTFGVCKPTSLTAGDSILDMGGDHWMSYLKSEWKSCASADNATACAAAGYSFTYDTGVLKSYSTLRTSWYYVDPPPPALPSSPPSTSPSPAPPSPPSPAPPRPPSPRPPSPSSASPSSASAVRLGWAAVLLQAVMFALAAPTGHH